MIPKEKQYELSLRKGGETIAELILNSDKVSDYIEPISEFLAFLLDVAQRGMAQLMTTDEMVAHFPRAYRGGAFEAGDFVSPYPPEMTEEKPAT